MTPSPPGWSETAHGSWGRQHILALAVILCVAAGLGWHHRPLALLTANDDAIYLALSQSLREGAYRNVHLATPTPHVKYPPGNPAWIAAVQSLGGDTLAVVQAANLVLLLLTALLAGDAVRRHTAPWLGVATVAAVAWNRTLLDLAGTLLSEIPFAFATTLAAWSALRAGPMASRQRWIVLAGLMSVMAFLIRGNGVASLGALSLWLLVVRQWKAFWIQTLAATGITGAWAGWVLTAPVEGPSYGNDLLALTAQGRLDGNTAGRMILGKLAQQVQTLMSTLDLPAIQGSALDNLAWTLLLAAGLGAAVIRLRSAWPVGWLTVLVSGLILLVWPWTIDRLSAPLVPLLLPLWLIGLWWLATGRRPSPGLPGLAVVAGGGGLACAALLASSQQARFGACAGMDPYARPGCVSDGERSLVLVARRARELLPADAVVATTHPGVAWHFSGRRTTRLTWRMLEADFSANQTAGNHPWDAILVSGFPSGQGTKMLEWLGAHCSGFTVLGRSQPAGLILGIRGRNDDACDALATFSAPPATGEAAGPPAGKP